MDSGCIFRLETSAQTSIIIEFCFPGRLNCVCVQGSSSSSSSDSSSKIMEFDLSGEESDLDEELFISDMPVICWAEDSFRGNHSR